MKKIAIIIFDQFTDLDLFLMWDILGRNKTDWKTEILGQRAFHISTNGLTISTQGHISQSKNADVVLFSSGKGTRTVIKDRQFLQAFSLDPKKQIIGSICSGSLILAALGLLKNIPATTHPLAKQELQKMGIEVVDEPLVHHGNIATAGGCLSAIYLVGWVIELLYGVEKRDQALSAILPVGQVALYKNIIDDSINRNEHVHYLQCKL